MAYLFLAKEYFIGEVLIPNLTTATPAGTANIAELTSFCSIYEPKFLKQLLGEDLYDLYIAGINVGSPEAKWTALKNKIYGISGVTTTYITPAANYVYFYLRVHQQSISATSGELSPDFQNAQKVANRKLFTVWNRMVDMVEEIQEWLSETAQVTTYPDFVIEDEFERINQWGI